MKKLINARSLVVLVFFLAIVVYKNWQKKEALSVIEIRGTTMGTIPYVVKYLNGGEKNLQKEIDSLLIAFNQSLSTYIPDSEVSRFNRNNQLRFESGFLLPVLSSSQEVYKLTGGAFDPTVGPLVSAWGFGKGKSANLSNLQIDSLKALVGYHKINFNQDSVWKYDSQVSVNFSAIAKGYAADLVIELLSKENISDAFVEIGGEVRCIGVNHEKKPWRIGIEDPIAVEKGNKEISAVISLKNRALATSGNYRNFYIKDGKKYAHTISPFTGYPVSHNLLSASVFADNCMTADALATAMMVLGLEKSINIAAENNAIDIFLIYSDENGGIKTYFSEGIKADVVLVPKN